MSTFTAIGNWIMGGLRRYRGIQYPSPAYTESAAATVTYDSAMQLSAVWACVKLLSETVASLPLNVYRLGENDRKVDENHYLSVLFRSKVNKYQTRVEFFETVCLNLVMHGNAYCQIEKTGTGLVVSLMPLMSAQMETRLLDDGSVVHVYTQDSGVTVFAAESIWHLKLMGNGIIGMSPLAYQRNTLGIAQAAETAVTKIYRNGAKPSGVLKLDKILNPAQRAQLRESFNTLTATTDDRLMVLEGGMDFQAISLSPEDIELLESRKFQISEICRWYGVPSVMVNDNNGSTVWGSGIEQIVAGFYKLTLRPILEKIEASIEANLFRPIDRGRMQVEFDFDALLRADLKSRYDSYRVGINAGVLKPNEARALEHLPPVDGGDRLFIQGAMMPIDILAQTTVPQGQENADEEPADQLP